MRYHTHITHSQILKQIYIYIYINISIFIYILEKEMETHSSILAWAIPWTEEPGRPQSMGSQRVRHDLVTKKQHI